MLDLVFLLSNIKKTISKDTDMSIIETMIDSVACRECVEAKHCVPLYRLMTNRSGPSVSSYTSKFKV